MTKETFTKQMVKLCQAYDCDKDANTIEIYFDLVKSYTPEILEKSIDQVILNNKFFPKVADLVEECERQKKKLRYEIVEFMKSKGYFKSPREYEKTMLFLDHKRECIPEWLQKHMNEYYKAMVNEKCELLGEPRTYSNVQLLTTSSIIEQDTELDDLVDFLDWRKRA